MMGWFKRIHFDFLQHIYILGLEQKHVLFSSSPNDGLEHIRIITRDVLDNLALTVKTELIRL